MRPHILQDDQTADGVRRIAVLVYDRHGCPVTYWFYVESDTRAPAVGPWILTNALDGSAVSGVRYDSHATACTAAIRHAAKCQRNYNAAMAGRDGANV